METRSRARRGRKKALPAGVEPPELARRIAGILVEKRAEDVVLMDLRGLTSACDFFVLASALSEPHVGALAEEVEGALSSDGIRPWHIEGRRNRRWVLVDYVDVVVHLFLKETREYYRLENLWAEAPREEITPAGPGERAAETGGAGTSADESAAGGNAPGPAPVDPPDAPGS